MATPRRGTATSRGPSPSKPNWCAHPSAARAGKDKRNLTGSNGQACFWYALASPFLPHHPDRHSDSRAAPPALATGSRTVAGSARRRATATPGSSCRAAPTSTYGTAPTARRRRPSASATSTAASSSTPTPNCPTRSPRACGPKAPREASRPSARRTSALSTPRSTAARITISGSSRHGEPRAPCRSLIPGKIDTARAPCATWHDVSARSSATQSVPTG